MHVISEKKLREFWTVHPDAESPLRSWYRVVKRAQWRTFADVREVYSRSDQVEKFTIFDIGGNKYRLITVIRYNRGKVFIRDVLTHEEYNRGRWKKD